MLLVLVLGVGFTLQLYWHYYDPEFLSYPATYNFKADTSFLQPINGNTIAIRLFADSEDDYATNADVRFLFEGKDYETGLYTIFDAVKCIDLYADQIALEKDSSDEEKFFTNAFEDDGLSELGWICPNATTTRNLLFATIEPCSQGINDKYAENITCSTDTFKG